MSWAKRNLYFLISCIVAVVLLGAAGWYCWTSYQANDANWAKLTEEYNQMRQLAGKNPGPGNDTVDNIKTAKDQTAQAKQRVAELEKFFTPVKSIPDTNKLDNRMLAFAVRETVSQLRRAAQDKGVVLPGAAVPGMGMPGVASDFAFSFSLQAGKTVYDPSAWEMLAKQMGEVKTICDTLFNARILNLDAIQRERTSDDANQQSGSQADYTDSISLTNGDTVITPYQITFECFTPQLGLVLASFANQSHTVVVKTLNVQPVDIMMGGMMGGMMEGGRDMNGNIAGQPPVGVRPGTLPTIIDEKKLRVIMLLDFIKITPAPGR
jgi:hypothetical protein